MTRSTNARVAGFTFLFYIAAGLASLVLFGRATRGAGVGAKLATLAQHTTELRAAVVLTLFTCFSALVLAVTLYAITREVDRDLAMLGLVCRVGEGFMGALTIPRMLSLLWLATATGANAPEGAGAHALGAFLLRGSPGPSFFAVGSTLFSYLLLRGRMIPAALAWLGLIASVLLTVMSPLQLAGLLGGPATWTAWVDWLAWLPMLVFEVTLALWLLIKGVALPRRDGESRSVAATPE